MTSNFRLAPIKIMDMERQQVKRRKIIKTSIGINQLPEQIFHEIFRYLEYNTIILSLRKVCTKFRQHVDTFTTIIGVFMLTGTDSSPSKVMYIFKTNRNDIKGIYESAPGCPVKPSSSISLSDTIFVERMDNFNHRNIKDFNEKILIETCNSGFVMFDWKCLEWSFLEKTIPSCNGCSNHNWKLTSNPHQFNYHSGSNLIYHSTRGKIGEYHMSLYARFLNVNLEGDDIHDSFSWCTFQIHIPPRLKCIFNSQMIKCGTGVIFIGGHYAPPQGLSFKNLIVDCNHRMIF